MKDVFSRCGLEIRSNAQCSPPFLFTVSMRFARDETLPFLTLANSRSPSPIVITSSQPVSHITHLLSSLYPILSFGLSSKVGCQPSCRISRGMYCMREQSCSWIFWVISFFFFFYIWEIPHVIDRENLLKNNKKNNIMNCYLEILRKCCDSDGAGLRFTPTVQTLNWP